MNKLTNYDKELIWKRYYEIETKDTEKSFLDVLALDEERAEKAKQIMLENFTDEERDFEDFNFMILQAAIIIAEQI